jgi:hypothetical protein
MTFPLYSHVFRIQAEGVLYYSMAMLSIDIETYQMCIHILRISCHFQPYSFEFKVFRKQIPLAVCYATTFNGCQGLTVQKLGLNLQRDVFSLSQLYSAMTCVPDSKNVLILKYEGDSSTCTTNIV